MSLIDTGGRGVCVWKLLKKVSRIIWMAPKRPFLFRAARWLVEVLPKFGEYINFLMLKFHDLNLQTSNEKC